MFSEVTNLTEIALFQTEPPLARRLLPLHTHHPRISAQTQSKKVHSRLNNLTAATDDPSAQLFIEFYASAYPWAARQRWLPASLLGMLARHLHHPRNPRSPEYMREFAGVTYGDVSADRFVSASVDQRLPSLEWGGIKEVVLLWPDANGLGWTPIEREVFRSKPAAARVTVLNGRRRTFVLNKPEWREVRRRRFVEKSLLAEAAFTLTFFVATPLLLLIDLARGKR